MRTDTAGFSRQTSYLMDSRHEYGPAFSSPLGDLADGKNDLIDVSVRIRDLDTLNRSLLVVSFEDEKGIVMWSAVPVKDYDPGTGEWYTVYHSVRPGRHYRPKILERRNPEVKVYIWNRGHDQYLMDDFRILARPGNPVLYGLTEKI